LSLAKIYAKALLFAVRKTREVWMLGAALYYPHIDISNGGWLRSAILFWDEIQTIAPTSIQDPYSTRDTKICEEEGYLRPLRCDLHPEILDDIGQRVLKFLEEKDWKRKIVREGYRTSPDRRALLHADKLGQSMKWRLGELVGVHPDKMSPAVRSFLLHPSSLSLISSGKISDNTISIIRDMEMFGVHSGEMSREMRRMAERLTADEGDEWVIVDSRFAEIYMSTLAAILSKEIQLSALTDEVPSSGVNLRSLVDDVAASGDAAARGAIVSIVMKGLKVDPDASLKKLIAFRKARKDQLLELSGLFDELKSKIERSSSSKELEDGAKRLFENKIQPGLQKLKNELHAQSIQSVWEGLQRGFTVSAAGGSALAYLTGYTGPLLLGAAAFITLSDVGVKSYLARSKARAASPYTYLFDVERNFTLPS
jgi:hypothetical protein